MEGLVINQAFWQGRRVLLTGHTGFKGAWLSLWLQQLQAVVCGLALDPPSTPSLFEIADVGQGMEDLRGDIRDLALVKAVISDFAQRYLIHLAAQSLVRQSYIDPVTTYATNVMGTAHVLDAGRGCASLRAVVVVTSDKCYENREWDRGHRRKRCYGRLRPL